MSRTIRKAAVLGAGVMGSAVAAHLANAGASVLLLDMMPSGNLPAPEHEGLSPEDKSERNQLAETGLAAIVKSNPPAFYDPSDARLIQVGNFEDDLPRLSECDWVIEAVVENLEAKRALLARIAPHLGPDAILSSNTSGISIAAMAEVLPELLRGRFLGTHFFNPPRYMKLLEIIPGPETNEPVIDDLQTFAERRLGKGVVRAKDTPNFIANRIGTYGLLVTLHAMQTHGLGVDEVDAITGPAMGRPKSATFRTLDLVGIDTFVHVANNVRQSVPNDWERQVFTIPDIVRRLVEHGWVGEKAGQGFYKKQRGQTGSEILTLDLNTFDYRPRRTFTSPSLDAAKAAPTHSERLNSLIHGTDAASLFAWEIIKKTLLYTAVKQTEIADTTLAVDLAMKWGFNWQFGPYETWDAIGLVPSVNRMKAEGEAIPSWIEDLISTGASSFYTKFADGTQVFLPSGASQYVVHRPDHVISLEAMKQAGRTIRENRGASLVDIGDGVACLEFHSLKQAIGPDVLQMLDLAADEVSNNWDALVIGNQAKNFCVGANIMLMLMEAQEENWDEIDGMIRRMQHSLLRLKYLDKPVVAAPFAMTLGGGAEVCFPADVIHASAETHLGLVEFGLGLIPAGGGTKELLLRNVERVPEDLTDRLDGYVRRTLETIAFAKVSTSAKDAMRIGYLRPSDRISVNPDHHLYDAKQTALSLARTGYRPPVPAVIPVIGEAGAAALHVGVYGMRQSGHISSHDEKVARQLIRVITGGAVPRGTKVTEQGLLDLEREAFLSLIGEQRTQMRMQHMIQTGKVLRN